MDRASAPSPPPKHDLSYSGEAQWRDILVPAVRPGDVQRTQNPSSPPITPPTLGSELGRKASVSVASSGWSLPTHTIYNSDFVGTPLRPEDIVQPSRKTRWEGPKGTRPHPLSIPYSAMSPSKSAIQSELDFGPRSEFPSSSERTSSVSTHFTAPSERRNNRENKIFRMPVSVPSESAYLLDIVRELDD
eukprot:PhF_6_TR14089/c0_g1_i2/m.22511